MMMDGNGFFAVHQCVVLKQLFGVRTADAHRRVRSSRTRGVDGLAPERVRGGCRDFLTTVSESAVSSRNAAKTMNGNPKHRHSFPAKGSGRQPAPATRLQGNHRDTRSARRYLRDKAGGR